MTEIAAVNEIVTKHILSNLGSKVKFDEARTLVGNMTFETYKKKGAFTRRNDDE